MRPAPRCFVACFALLCVALLSPRAEAGSAPPNRRTPVESAASRHPSRRDTRPPQGWVVERARFEPLDPARPVEVDELGAYRGAIDIVPNGGAVAVVNHLPLEDYLLGISEVPPTWPIEAQRAQAIAARTYAAFQIAKPTPAMSAIGADLCADDACQVYTGLAKERRPNADTWAAAVASTRGLALLYMGAPILAKYSSTNGGRTVAGGRPYLRAFDDPDDAVSPYHAWRVEVPLADLTGAFGLPGEAFAVQRVGDIVDIDWRAHDGMTAGVTQVPVSQFRAVVDDAVPAPAGLPVTVPSVRFELSVDAARGVVVLDGRGWGHGIGMSQFGALGRALRGVKAADILAAYYGGIRPTPTRLPTTVAVALDASRASATVSGEGRFRVLDQAGHALGVVASGEWRVVPAGRGHVRVLPPAGDVDPPSVTPLSDPLVARSGEPINVKFRVSAPAAVKVTLRGADGGREVVVAARIVDAGEVVQALPALPSGGYVVTISADAGGGRTTSAPVPVHVVRPIGAAPVVAPRPLLATAGWSHRAPRAFAALLLTLLVSVVALNSGQLAADARVQWRALRDRRGA